jgi:hypothetical protein
MWLKWNILWHIYWPDTKFGLVIGFIGLLKLVTVCNYSIIANSHTSQCTIACTNFSQFTYVFINFCFVRVLNNVDSSASVLMPLPAGDCLATPSHDCLLTAWLALTGSWLTHGGNSLTFLTYWNSSWFSLFSLSMALIENTVLPSSGSTVSLLWRNVFVAMETVTCCLPAVV